MGNRIIVTLALLATTAVSASVSWTRSARDRKPPAATGPSLATEDSPIESLNRCIQARFHNLEAFGMSRMGVHSRGFYPKTPEEKVAVSGLREGGWEVGFYLGGRELLERSGITEAEWYEGGKYDFNRTISESVAVGRAREAPDLPRPWELWGHARKALAASDVADSYTASIGRWSIDARPVRADRQACLKCHDEGGATAFPPPDGEGERPLRVGDALGVVIYAYARAPK